MHLFNYLADLSAGEIGELITLARRLNEKPEPRALEGKVLSLLFLSPSLRTLISFQAAMLRMGGGTFIISPNMSIHNLESRSGIVMDGVAAEHIREAVPVIACYGDAIGIRAFETDAVRSTGFNNPYGRDARDGCDGAKTGRI
jgi:N-acetylornithine carbamoyltransferase